MLRQPTSQAGSKPESHPSAIFILHGHPQAILRGMIHNRQFFGYKHCDITR
jgi:hypothetical protein